MVTKVREAPPSGQSEQIDLLRRDGKLTGGASMRNGYIELYWNCQIWRRSHGVYDVKCLRADAVGVYYGRLLHLKTVIREHVKKHDQDPDEPCRLAEDLRGSQNGEE